MNFLDYPAYVIGCLGVGDIICSLNALENIGREKGRRIDVYVVHTNYFKRVFDIYSALDLKLINLHFSDLESISNLYGEDRLTMFQAFGMEVSWVKGWLSGWGLRSSIGYEHMVNFRRQMVAKAGQVGVSFTVVSNPSKNINRESAIKVISDHLDQGNDVVYYGFNEDCDRYLVDHFGRSGRVKFCPHDLRETIDSIGSCEKFTGADSGMAWLAAFHRVPTRILVGPAFGGLPNTFGDMPWVQYEVYDHA